MDVSQTFLIPLLLLLISLMVGIVLRQNSKQSDKLDDVKDTISEQKVAVAEIDGRVRAVESSVTDLKLRRNDDEARTFALAADALLELRDDRRRRKHDRIDP